MALEPPLRLPGGEGFAPVVALGQSASEALEENDLLGCLDFNQPPRPFTDFKH